MDDLHTTWPHRWITSKKIYDSSPIDGTGTFASEPIKKDEVVAVYGGIIVPAVDIEKYREKIGGIRGLQLDEDFFICPTEPKGGLFNHSCKPNLGYATSIKIVAIKDTEAGEELVFDYGMSETNFKSFTCNCGNSDCRKKVTPDDWKDKDLQRKYGEYFAPYLRERF